MLVQFRYLPLLVPIMYICLFLFKCQFCTGACVFACASALPMHERGPVPAHVPVHGPVLVIVHVTLAVPVPVRAPVSAHGVVRAPVHVPVPGRMTEQA